MLEILEKIKPNYKFLETKFKEYPFQLKKDEDINLSSISNLNKDNSEKNRKDESEKSKEKLDDTKNYKNPVIFQILNENQPIFKVYNPEQLQDALFELEQYYSFSIDKESYRPRDIIKLKEENKIENKVIIICPFIAEIFNALCKRFNYDVIKGVTSFEIEKELLEPFFLYIEKKELGYENNDKFDNNLLNKNLTFIMNKEREQFINELNNYANIDIQKEPMIIIGNDGVGKTLTLQLYTLIELKGYKKLYLNLKLFEKCNPRNYFLIC